MNYGSKICPITGYSDFDPRDEPEPEEEEKEQPMENAFMQPVLNFLQAALGSNLTGAGTLNVAIQMLKDIPIQAAYCPVCMDQFDAATGELAPPTVVKMRSCGHYACDRCARHCADIGCANDGCEDCMSICEGHAEPHCRQHTIAKNYCKECSPERLQRECERPAYCYED